MMLAQLPARLLVLAASFLETSDVAHLDQTARRVCDALGLELADATLWRRLTERVLLGPLRWPLFPVPWAAAPDDWHVHGWCLLHPRDPWRAVCAVLTRRVRPASHWVDTSTARRKRLEQALLEVPAIPDPQAALVESAVLDEAISAAIDNWHVFDAAVTEIRGVDATILLASICLQAQLLASLGHCISVITVADSPDRPDCPVAIVEPGL